MGRLNRFVKPETIRIEISEGDWIEIKRELTVGEFKRFQTRAIKMSHRMELDMDRKAKPKAKESDDRMEVVSETDLYAMTFAKVEAYLVGWSFAEAELDDQGKPKLEDDKPIVKPVPLTPESIQALDEATFDEITEAIDKHTDAVAQEKKRIGGRGK